MWIVRLALRRPYTFVVMSVLIAVLGVAAIFVTPTDIFPHINIPVVTVIWSYTGLPPEEMANRIVTICERALTTTVNNIEHMESTSYNGVAVIRIFFQPNAHIEMAVAQTTALVQTILRPLPPGTFPPLILQYDASSVPILQLGVHSPTLDEQQLNDLAQNFVRTQLATVQGAAVPLPYGGKPRAVMVDLDPNALYAKHMSATDVSNALNLQTLVLPAGTAKVGGVEYQVALNSQPSTAAAMNDLPIRTVNGATVYVRDVANVRDGSVVQTNVVRQDGRRSVLLTVLRNGDVSTLDIISRVKQVLPSILAGLPKTFQVTPLFDQSLFVRASISGVLREASIAAVLTALMILVFLGSWRSTLIVCTSIPLSILTSILIFSALGQTINVMTLGGLALAVGILVDDATVEIENVHRQMGMRKPLVRAILDGAQQIAVPAFVSTLSICIVFVPVLLLSGAARYLFTPLAMAVVFAMLMSYFLTRTLVPTMVHYMLRSELALYQQPEGADVPEGRSRIWRFHLAFEHRFERLRERYRGALTWTLDHRGFAAGAFGVFALGSLLLVLVVGRDFFPYVDAGQMRLQVRTPAGTRIEETERIFADVEREIRQIIPADRIETILDNIGLPQSGINLAFGDVSTMSAADGEILIALKEPGRTLEYTRELREGLKAKFPGETFFFTPADITSQILNFGLPSPVDVQVSGHNAAANYRIASELLTKIVAVPGTVDVRLRQEVAAPAVLVNVDRTKANESGLTQRDVASSMLISLSSSGQVSPNQWLNPVNGVSYQINVQTPQYRIDSFDALHTTSVTSASGTTTQLLANVASLRRTTANVVVNHYNVQPVFDVYASVDNRDLGGTAADVQRIIDDMRPHLPEGTTVTLRGQVETMRASFTRLGTGMIFAVLLVYLLMVVNFQSWVDPFIILMALPGALAGILWILFVTQTTLNVPSMMGAIMSIGVATANSILLVTFANDARLEGRNARDAVLEAGYIRIRPVIMTALAMLIGMVPMAFGLGEGGEQNAPLARAVIGGLLVATMTTLFFVPIVYTWLRKTTPVDMDRRIEEEEHEGEADRG